MRYPHPLLKDVLASTYGVITYQEQVMRMAQVLAGFTLAEADVLRKAVGKKDDELLRKEVGKFVERALANGVEQHTADDIADQVVTFGRYGFNRSHSVAYALLSYQTAWLKCHYPAEFMAALLSSVVDKTDDVVHYIAECRELLRGPCLAAERHAGPAAGRQRVRLEVHAGQRGGDPFRARRTARCGRRRSQFDSANRALRGGSVQLALRSGGPRGFAGGWQARAGSDDPGGRV